MKLLKITMALLACGMGVAVAMGAPKANKEETATPLNFYNNNPVLATAEGEPIYLEELVNKNIHDQLQQLYQLLNSELKVRLIEKLSEKHPDLKLKNDYKVSRADIENFYAGNNLSRRGPLEQMAPQIEQYLVSQAKFREVDGNMALALNKGLIKNYLKPPVDYVVSASTETAVIRHNPKAKVMLLEFSDYQCPFCGRVQPTINNLIEKYKGKVAFGYRHFPLQFHTEADEAAIAVECARDQGKFEEMHQLLFQNQRNQHIPELKSYARKIEVADLKKFDQCLDNDTYRDRVDQDIQDGAKIGISGTPGFLIGTYDEEKQEVRGEILSGAQPAHAFEQALIKYLSKQS